jgi:hypothetical protein
MVGILMRADRLIAKGKLVLRLTNRLLRRLGYVASSFEITQQKNTTFYAKL